MSEKPGRIERPITIRKLIAAGYNIDKPLRLNVWASANSNSCEKDVPLHIDHDAKIDDPVLQGWLRKHYLRPR